MFTNSTNPLVKIDTYNFVIEKYNSMKAEFDSINTVNDEKHFLYLKISQLTLTLKLLQIHKIYQKL